MFKKREVTDNVSKAEYIRSQCVGAEDFNRCTHIFVKQSTKGFTCPPGMYEYRMNGGLYQDDIPIVHSKKGQLITAMTNKYIEILTHQPTLDDIMEEQELKTNKEDV